MSKNKATVLLSILSVIISVVLVFTFLQFPVGAKDNYVGAIGAIELDYDLSGGVAYTLTLAPDNEKEVKDVDEVIDVLRQRIEALGYSSYTIKALKSNDPAVLDQDIRIELKNTDTVTEDMLAIAAYGELEFYGGTDANPSTQILKDIKVVQDSQYLGMIEEGNYCISIVLTDEGKSKLLETINETEGTYYLKITCGEEFGVSNPLFNSTIDESVVNGNTITISQIKTEKGARRLALQVKNGGLAYKYDGYTANDAQLITSLYGEDIATKCLVGIITLVVVTMAVLCVVYKGLGIISALSFLLFIICETWLMIGVPGIVLSMGGVFGIIASTVLCAISLMSFAQRVKDEYANSKKTVKAAVSKGLNQSLVPTISLHVVAGIVALSMLALTGGIVRNFATTFGIGVAVSLISSLVFTRMYTGLILPLVKNKEKFLRFKRNEQVSISEEVEEA